ncbi:uncharacterized protein LOC141608218 [Silene latifolia]|uniref:uncharacterized protein LOC141608218 n=1 Tax=Silene latifolia TaxID=37657 RepID=UPI003D782614
MCLILLYGRYFSYWGSLYLVNKQEASERVYSRLDRAMGNLQWMAMFGDYIAHFHPKGLFDHCPCTVMNMRANLGGKRSFKYNMWGKAADFKPSVLSVWRGVYTGTNIGVIKKLKALKPVLKKLNNTCFSDIENTTAIAGLALENIQKALVDNPGDLNLSQQEQDLASDLKELTVARDSFLSQKAKIQWPIEGDLNTAFFHHAIKKRVMMNKVFQIEDKYGRLCTEGSDIQMAFLDYYQSLLGSDKQTLSVQQHVVSCGPCCTEEHWLILAQPVTLEEVKHNIFSIPNGKSPGPDGYSSQFYKDAWDIVGDEVGAAVVNFFEYGRLLVQFGFFKGKRGLRQGDPISPLIFCICMEYLTRVMEYATGKWYFRYHPLCKSLKLTHLLFADDLLIFCKGDIKSIMLLLRALSTFSETSGLKVNVSKSEVVFNGVPDEVRMDVVQVSGFQQGVLSFKYLGVPIQPGRLSKADCHILLDKIVNKIRGIGARKLSYAGRLILINFVVLLIAWEKICCRKKEGGLDIKLAEELTGKHINLRPPDSSWSWRNICKIKDVFSVGFVGGQWQSDVSGYSISSGYHWLQGPHPLVHWYNSVWASRNILKNSLVGWMIKHQGLNTREKLFQLQISDRNNCVNCEQAVETHENLFFSCVYGSQITAGIENWLNRRLYGSNLNCTKL